MSGVDSTIFNQIKERMKNKFPMLLEVFLTDSKSYLETIGSNIESGNIDEVIAASHSLKSSSGLLGLVDVQNSSATMEHTAKELQSAGNTDLSSLKPISDEMNLAFDTVKDGLYSELEKLKSA